MSEWISINDRLPDEFGWFLVVDGSLSQDKVTLGFSRVMLVVCGFL